MAGLTLVQAEAKLALYLDAEEKILAGQEIAINGRDLKRADLKAVQEGIALWDGRVQQKSRGGMRSVSVAPQG